MTDLAEAAGGKVWTPEAEEAASVAKFERSPAYTRIVLCFSALFLLSGLAFVFFDKIIGHAEGDIWIKSNIQMLFMVVFFFGFAGVLASTLIKQKSFLASFFGVIVTCVSVFLLFGVLVSGFTNYSPSTEWTKQQAFGDEANSWTWVSTNTEFEGDEGASFINEAGETRKIKFVKADEFGTRGVKVELEAVAPIDSFSKDSVG